MINRRWPILALLGALLLTGCSAKRAARKQPQTPQQTVYVVPATDRQVSELVKEARRWIGTPYAYGGHSRKGTDCSGFIMEIFSKVFDIKLPRSSAMQAEYARPLKEDKIVPGDLVFFTTGKSRSRINHVGLYIGDGRMIHASSSKGVMESGLDESYWQRTRHSQGRVVETDARERDRQPEPPVKIHMQELYDALDQQIDSLYVSNPELFD